MPEIVPNWHPIFVHFTVALVVASSIFFVAAAVFPKSGWSDALKVSGHWTLRLGGLMTVLTLAAGLYAYGTVTHDAPSHAAMTDHRNWAFIATAFVLAGAAWSTWKAGTAEGGGVLYTLLAVATVLVLMTAYKGGDLVYRYGLGVQSLPIAEGDGHDHDHGPALSHESDKKEVKAVTEGGHDRAEGEEHDHAATDNEMPQADPASISDAFNHALQAGDKEAVFALLSEDVVVLESGHAQHSRAEYMAGHMISDMAFLKSITRKVLDRETGKSGGLAWITTHSHMTGDYKGRTIDMPSREMLILKLKGGQWKITMVHWGDK